MPETGSFAGWPLVLYFHHCSWVVDHYTALTPQAFALGLDLVLDRFEPLDPHELPRTPAPGTPKGYPSFFSTLSRSVDGGTAAIQHTTPRPSMPSVVRCV